MSVVLCLTCVKAVVGVVCGPSGGATAEDGAPAGRWRRRRRPAGTRLIRGRRHWLPPPYKYRLPLRRRQTPAGGGRERAGQQVDTATQDSTGLDFSLTFHPPPPGWKSMKERRPCPKLSLKSAMDPGQSVKCKIVVVGDSQCGKTALLHVFAKDCFPEVRARYLHTDLMNEHVELHCGSTAQMRPYD